MERKLSIDAPTELVEAIDKARAEQAVETGEIPSRAQWLREAARKRLGGESYSELSEAQEGAA